MEKSQGDTPGKRPEMSATPPFRWLQAIRDRGGVSRIFREKEARFLPQRSHSLATSRTVSTLMSSIRSVGLWITRTCGP